MPLWRYSHQFIGFLLGFFLGFFLDAQVFKLRRVRGVRKGNPAYRGFLRFAKIPM